MFITDCLACQYGQHGSHVAVQPPPIGALGGQRCPCTGDCAERHPDPVGEAISEGIRRILAEP